MYKNIIRVRLSNKNYKKIKSLRDDPEVENSEIEQYLDLIFKKGMERVEDEYDRSLRMPTGMCCCWGEKCTEIEGR